MNDPIDLPAGARTFSPAENSSHAPEPASENTPVDQDRLIRKVANRVMWWLLALYFVSVLDRSAVAYAAVPMSKDIGLTTAMYGFGVGIMYLTYALFEIPSNLLLARIGARLTFARIAILWGLCTVFMAAMQSPASFYAARAFLGAAEAGLFPGVMLYLTFWFPHAYRARYNAMFTLASPAAVIVGAVISGPILSLDGVLGIAGWRWLFLIEGLPAVMLGLACYLVLYDSPAGATWLSPHERAWLRSKTTEPKAARKTSVRDLFRLDIALLALCNFAQFAGLVTFGSWLPQILHAQGWNPSQAGLLTALPSVVGVAGMFIISRNSDQTGERFLHSSLAFVMTALGYALAAGGGHSTIATLVGFTCASIGLFATQAVFWTIPQNYLAPSLAPLAVGFIAMVGSIGGALAPMVLGWTKDATGDFQIGFAGVALLLVVAAVAVAIAAKIVVRPVLGRPS